MELGFFARADSLDFRDRMFQPSLVEVPAEVPLSRFTSLQIPVLQQRHAWACTGFALATVVHYLLRRREWYPDQTVVSPNMLFEMARRYDEYPGDRYLGSSARGAMKGWHLHGVCSAELWPYQSGRRDRQLTPDRVTDAARRPLGAYFRVNHRDLVAMHCALAEVGVLYAVANVHSGWIHPRAGGVIAQTNRVLGSHAVAIVGYNDRGFWLQNSWGRKWGEEGIGFLPYDDWLEHGVDAWAARLGVPTRLERVASAARVTASASALSRTQVMSHLRPHLVRVDGDGFLQSNDVYGTSEEDLRTLFESDFVTTTKRWKKKRILLYAGGGLVSLSAGVQRAVADYRASMLGQEIYPIAFVWRPGFWETIGGHLRQALNERKPDAGIGSDVDFLLERMDDALEPLVRELGGKLHWDEKKRTALQASTRAEGAVRLTLQHIARLVARDPSVEVHMIGHSAGAILLAPAVQYLTSTGRIGSGPMRGRQGLGVRLQSCTLWAPACTTQLFHQTFYDAILTRRIRRFLLMTLSDAAERADNCAGVYRKSLLYLISNALEVEMRVPSESDGAEIMGMEKFVNAYVEFKQLLRRKSVSWIVSPNQAEPDAVLRSTARHHGDFDDDPVALISSLSCVLNRRPRRVQLAIHRSAASSRSWRLTL